MPKTAALRAAVSEISWKNRFGGGGRICPPPSSARFNPCPVKLFFHNAGGHGTDTTLMFGSCFYPFNPRYEPQETLSNLTQQDKIVHIWPRLWPMFLFFDQVTWPEVIRTWNFSFRFKWVSGAASRCVINRRIVIWLAAFATGVCLFGHENITGYGKTFRSETEISSARGLGGP